ncbi:uncharacterized protein DUF4126 [Homoserinimonas aerilata]|uniref:Uncharacterized protein DUF4126 n=1 Tax=Homoserinimonas aerilata TaxID=1162970 RepID=A0A542YIT9_9MICO|nr:DUF4126 domain-containing protein [Homoserinimonas aerilata]TQL48010.1 uncharacterized protein DUF4126 [Homoserinimonas aerilata]
MLEFLTGTGLALSAGLNAYIPLLLIGLASRFLDFVELPAGWLWLENEWVLGILAVLLVIELVADKIPAVDSVNDWIQTLVRPTAGGLAFGSGSSSETLAVTDPAQFFESNQWVPIATGAALALLVHLAKMIARPVANAVTLGAAAPVLSTMEDAGSVVLSVLALVVPILVIVAVPLLGWWIVSAVRRARRKRRESAATG